MKQVNRDLRKNTRDMDREMRKLDIEEKKAMAEIKKLSAAGQPAAAKMMAKNVVQLRNQKTKMIKGKAQLSGVQNMTKVQNACRPSRGSQAICRRCMLALSLARPW